jgi:RNA-directed DNA polymerase
MRREELVAEALADALLAVEPAIEPLAQRTAWTLGRKHRWIARFCTRLFHRFGSALSQADRRALVDWIRADQGYLRAWTSKRPPRIAHYPLDPPRMSPRRGALAACALPSLPTTRDLADWLGIAPGELEWFADLRRMNFEGGPLAHYRYRWIEKRTGVRIVEMPKPRLKEIQRKVLRGMLDAVPAHEAAHGFRRGRSCLTYASPHVAQTVVLRVDLRNFFTSVSAARVQSTFATLGYPPRVARLLAGLCTNGVPMRIARQGAPTWMAAKQLGVPHLPQGAPTSPAIANLCALHLDYRLDGLACSLGGRYTRYADDIAFSGGEEMRRAAAKLPILIAAIALEEGFEVNHRKTRIMHASDRQSLTGIVVNRKLNPRRAEFDRLKALLTNCARRGATSQNRARVADFRAHLAGRVAYVETLNPTRGARLRTIFQSIAWAA